MSNVFAAIQNRDAGALARMMGPDNHQAQQDNVVNISAERLVDALFKQLKQLFPAAEQTNLKTAQQETDAKRQWIAAFAEGGIRTREQVSAGMRHVNHRSGRHQVNSSSGAKTARWCLA
ncbi:Origin specific replication binding factor [Klebsiella pneumoniae]|nr:Origin specific replication binding factor [Klebsiella pneumoniae]